MKILPFNFDRLESGNYFISNMSGFYDFLDHKSLIEVINSFQTSSTEKNNRLESKLFITSVENYDVAVAALGSALAKKILHALNFNPIFMIVPTLRCDHTCSYCQVSRAPVLAQNFDLDEILIPKIIKTIKKLSSAPYKIEIQGGEPLLRFDLIKRIFDEANNQLGPKKFEFVIATSLSLISDEILAWAKENSIYFSTSLDGSELIHNKNRILPNKNSYMYVKDAINKIHSEVGSDKVATVTTVTNELLSRPESLIEAHLEMGLNEMFVRPISPYGFANTKTPANYEMTEYIIFYKKLFHSIIQYNISGTPLLEHSAAIHIKRVLNPTFNNYADLKSPSGFALNSILFNYDGKVYGSDEARMLQRVIGKMDFSCGSVENIEIQKKLIYKEIIKSSFNILHPGCENCVYQPYCGVDPCQNISAQGEPIGDKSHSLFCQYHKAMFRFLLNTYHNCSKTQKILKGWLHA